MGALGQPPLLMKLARLTSSLRGKTVVVTGASRGVGEAIALRCARDGANVVMLARSADGPSHPKLQGHLHDVARRVSELGGVPFPIQVDLRDAQSTRSAVHAALDRFGGIDALVNNASAINIQKTAPIETYDLLMGVNARATANLLNLCHKTLGASEIGHALTISPPLHTLHKKWLLPHATYTTSKYAMSMLTLGYADVLRANTIWPKKLLKTAATKMLEEQTQIMGYTKGLPPERFAEAVHTIICSDITAMSCLDDDIHPTEDGIDDIFI